MKKVLFIIMVLSVRIMFSQENFSAYTNDRGNFVINGKISIEEWLEITKTSIDTVNSYNIDTLVSKKISEILNNDNYNFLIVGGSWCGDTKSEFPKLFKLINVLQLNQDKFSIFGVDRDKVINSIKFQKIQVLKVPSLLIFKNDIEIGRIEEYPESSWEKDLLIILGD